MPKKSKSLKNTTTTGNKNTPITALALLKHLLRIYQDPTLGKEALEVPVIMSSDEEGNAYGKLWAIDVNNKGEVTLIPADAVSA